MLLLPIYKRGAKEEKGRLRAHPYELSPICIEIRA